MVGVPKSLVTTGAAAVPAVVTNQTIYITGMYNGNAATATIAHESEDSDGEGDGAAGTVIVKLKTGDSFTPATPIPVKAERKVHASVADVTLTYVVEGGPTILGPGTPAAAAFGGNFRYWKITGVTLTTGHWWMLGNVRLFDAAGQGGTAYPANMTSATAPSPYVIATNNNYNATYPAWKAFDSDPTNSFYWAIGSTDGPADWLTVDLGSAVDVKSMTIKAGNSAGYAPTGFELYGSATGSFGGEETLVHTASGLPSVSGQVTNIG